MLQYLEYFEKNLIRGLHCQQKHLNQNILFSAYLTMEVNIKLKSGKQLSVQL